MKATLFTLFVLLASLLPASALDENLTAGCVSDYAADVDYFPQKVEIVDAAKFTVEYHNNYKVLKVADAFDGAPGFEYVLVQCGTPAPSPADFADDAQFIETPTGDLITLSTTQLPALAQLGLLDHLIGVDSGFYISSPAVADMIAAGEVAEVGFGAEVNIELILELEPQLVMSYGYNPATDAHPVLLEAGIFTALDASWRELSPLGRAEWLKFTALFYNQEAQANAIYEDIVARYEAIQASAAAVADEDRPQVLINSFLGYADAWFIPGGDTYVGQLIRDAGGALQGGARGAQRLCGGVADQLDGCPFQEMKRRWTYSVDVRANWKLVQDGQNEAYHFPFQHRRILDGSFVTNNKGHNRYQNVNLHNYHSVWSCEYRPSQKLTPLRMVLAANARETPLFHVSQMIGKMDHYVVFPNFVILLVQIGRSTTYVTYNLWPLAVDRTVWEIRMHFTEPTSLREQLRQEYFKCVSMDVLQEDTVAHENVHLGLASRAKSHRILQDDEIAIRFFAKTVEDFVGLYRND